MFGSRFSKGSGSLVNLLKLPLGAGLFAGVSAVVSLGLIGVWVFAAGYLGKINTKAVKEDKFIC